MDPIITPNPIGKGMKVEFPQGKKEEVIPALKNLIIATVKKDKEFKEKIAQTSESIKVELNKIVPYKEADKKVKEATLVRTKEKLQWMKRPNLARMDAKLSDLRKQRKENGKVMSDYCVEYWKMTQLSLFEEGGVEIQIVPSAKAILRMAKMSFGKGRHGKV